MNRLHKAPSQRLAGERGFTLIELLIVVAVISILVALTIPAVQLARESARQTQCRNNLRQMGLAVQNFEATHRFYPSNGWGYQWIGDPDRGVGRKQPGGWIYHLLPYLEQDALSQIGRGLAAPEKSLALNILCRTPVAVLQCPSRPSASTAALNPKLVFRNAIVTSPVAITHYAICEGDYITGTLGGPLTLADGDDPAFEWTDVSQASGVSFLRSEIRPRDITDGTSHTYLIGEKHVSQRSYFDASDDGFDQPMYSGVDVDIARWTTGPPLPDGLTSQIRRFGSAHAAGANMVYCDGSVKTISYLIDAVVHQSAGHRSDGGRH